MPPSKPKQGSSKNQRASDINDNVQARGAVENAERQIALPPDMLQKLLKNFFEDEGTKISAAAVDAVGEYLRTYMREGIWRAVAERRGGNIDGDVGPDGARAGQGLMLEVREKTRRKIRQA